MEGVVEPPLHDTDINAEGSGGVGVGVRVAVGIVEGVIGGTDGLGLVVYVFISEYMLFVGEDVDELIVI